MSGSYPEKLNSQYLRLQQGEFMGRGRKRKAQKMKNRKKQRAKKARAKKLREVVRKSRH